MHFRNCSGGWRDGPAAKSPALPEDQGSVLSAHTGQLTPTCNHHVRGSDHLFCPHFCVLLCAYTQTPIRTDSPGSEGDGRKGLEGEEGGETVVGMKHNERRINKKKEKKMTFKVKSPGGGTRNPNHSYHGSSDPMSINQKRMLAFVSCPRC